MHHLHPFQEALQTITHSFINLQLDYYNGGSDEYMTVSVHVSYAAQVALGASCLPSAIESTGYHIYQWWRRALSVGPALFWVSAAHVWDTRPCAVCTPMCPRLAVWACMHTLCTRCPKISPSLTYTDIYLRNCLSPYVSTHPVRTARLGRIYVPWIKQNHLGGPRELLTYGMIFVQRSVLLLLFF